MITAVDLGQRQDHAAVVRLSALDEADGHRRCWRVVQSEEIALGTSYEHLGRYAAHLAKLGGLVVLDASGVGAAPLEQARRMSAPHPVVGLTITSARNANLSRWPDITVPKRELLDAMRAALERRQIRIPGEARVLRQQLAAITTKPTARGGRRLEAAGSGHDDVAMSACMAAWTAAALDDHRIGGAACRTAFPARRATTATRAGNSRSTLG